MLGLYPPGLKLLPQKAAEHRPHSKTWRIPEAASNARQRLGLRVLLHRFVRQPNWPVGWKLGMRAGDSADIQ